MSITLDDIILPPDLHWDDEFDWTPVAQAVDYTLAGALEIQVGTRLAGRPITLVGGEGKAWTTRATVLLLQAKAALPGEEMTLTLNDARTFTVAFRHGDGQPVEARPIIPYNTPAAGDYYALTLRLMEV
jgi:hypothetical protein